MKKKMGASSSHRNMTRHRQIAKRRDVGVKISTLAKQWNKINPIQRGESLCELVDLGCSRRGLAKDLRKSETSVRRHMTLAQLPQMDRDAVKNGKSAKVILALKAERDRRRQIQLRMTEDVKTGAISDQLADYILEFCKAETGVRGSDLDNVTLFFNEVRNSLTRLDWEGGSVRKVRKSLPLKRRFKLTRPHPDNEEVTTAHLARWLALFLKSEVPERPIQDRAIDKAQARRKELKAPDVRPIRRALLEARLKYANLSASPKPRPY
jgi:hypothetical protein